MSRKENRVNKKISKAVIIFRVISLIIIIYCLIVLYRWNENNKQNLNIMNELKDYAQITDVSEDSQESGSETEANSVSKLEVDFSELKAKNSDTVAWVKVNNTNINFPIVKSSDNKYYLKHNFNKESNGAGWIFADYRCSFDELSKNTIVYGHNRRNGTMFSNLSYFMNDDWNFENENSYFSFATETKSYKAEIFSVYMISASKLTLKNEFQDNSEFQNYITSVKNLSIHDFNVEINENDQIITLCTCDNTSQNRIVVSAKLSEIM